MSDYKVTQDKRKLTLDQHAEIGRVLKEVKGLYCLIANSVKKSSRLNRLNFTTYKNISLLISEMENKAFRDGFSDVATDIYYDLSPHHGCDNIDELISKTKTKHQQNTK